MKKFFLFALAALAFVACNDTKQSELTEDVLGLNGEAKIQVQFFYNEGAKLVNGVEVNETLPVPNSVEVIAKVDYSQYTGAKEGKSYKQFSATSKGDGVYEVIIPAGEKAIKVELIGNGFEADYYVTPEKAVKAYYPKKIITSDLDAVLAGQAYVKNDPTETSYSAPGDVLNNSRTVEIKLITGKVTGKMERWGDKSVEVQDVNISKCEVELVIEPKSKEDKAKDSRVLKFTTECKDGEYKFQNIMIYDEWKQELEDNKDYLEMTLKVKSWADSEFKHFYKKADKDKFKKVWASEAAYKASGVSKEDYKDKPAKDWAKALDDLYYLDDGKNVYIYKANEDVSQKVLGAWSVADTKVPSNGSVYDVIVLFQESQGQDLTAKFAPADLNKVNGVGYFGNEVKVSTDKDDEYGYALEYGYDDYMGWDK